jgi:transmembrane sensor
MRDTPARPASALSWSALRRVDVRWSIERERSIRRAIDRHRRPRTVRRVLLGAAVAAMALGLLGLYPRSHDRGLRSLVDRPTFAPARTPGPLVVTHDWRQLYATGDVSGALHELEGVTLAGPDGIDEPDALLAAADVFRQTHHPERAVDPLERLVARHPGDPRAPTAAFTLGRVLLDELHRPGAAVDALRRSRALSPEGPLASDALAREVEALVKASRRGEAIARAHEYLHAYPHGAHREAVRQWCGLR